jgi:tetratricopeptide (TPR) repeat protein
LGLKAKDYLTFFTEDELAMPAYEWLKESVTTLGANAQVDVTRKLMEQSYKIYKSNPEQYGSQFLSDYELVSTTFDLIAKAGGKNAAQAQNEKAYADRMYAVSGAADCGTMDEKFASKVAESANDLETLMSIMKLYRRMDCTESDVYFAAVESAHKLQPSAESAAGCAQMCLKKSDLNGAVEYYKQALTLVESDEDKADYLYRMANVYVSLQNYRQSVEYANQALEINPEDGRCYLLIGMSYANGGKISDDPVLDRAKFWVACDMFQKAQSIDETCADAAKNFIKTYSQYFPTKEEIFFSRDLNEGQTYYVGSWINKSTRCRARKE